MKTVDNIRCTMSWDHLKHLEERLKGADVFQNTFDHLSVSQLENL